MIARGRARRTTSLAGLVACALLLGACGSSDDAGPSTSDSSGAAPAASRPIQPIAGASSKPEITIGSKNFTEQYVLGELYAQTLEAAGFRVDKQLDIGSELLAFKALRRGRIDGYPEYTGTALTSFFGVPITDAPRDGGEAYAEAKAEYAKVGVTALPPTLFDSTFRVVLTKAEAARLGNPKTISDLAPNAAKLRISGYPECRQRTDCLIGLQRTYGFKFKGFVGTGQIYQALDTGSTQVTFATATDGELSSGKYVVLQDDRKFFPSYNATLTLRDETAAEIGPEGVADIARMQSKLTEQIMRELNARVAIDKQTPEQAAREYLQAAGLVD